MNSKSMIAFATVAALFVLASAIPVCAGNIEGYLYTPFGSAQSAVSVSANRDGNLYPAGFGWANTWEAYPVGWYYIGGLAPGNYQMLFHEKDHWPRYIQLGVDVPANGTVYVYRTIEYPNHMTGLGWGEGTRYAEWCQSFVATGTSLTMVALHQAIEFGPETRITIHEGGLDGPQIGPSRTIPTVVVNPTAAFWNHGDVPLVPGREYCVKLYVPDGQLPFLGAGKIQGGVAYPDGRTWRNGELIGDPIKITLCQDDDGILTVVNTKKKRSDTPPLSYVSVRSVGQTFVARGSSMLSVSLLVGSTGGQKLTATVHTDPGLLGEGGPQVGVGKNIKPCDWNWYSGAVWKPGEVPLQDGQSYYVKIERADRNPFTVYYVPQNEYQGGEMWIDSNMRPDYELSTTLTCEEFAGSLTVPRVRISGIEVARATNSATISWTTDVPATTNYVQYSKTIPYQSTASDASGGTSHSVTLAGLSPNTLYHYRVVSKVDGCRDGCSRDFVFVTDPDTTNLLINPGFENGVAAPWNEVKISGNLGVQNYPANGSKGDWFGVKAHSGNWFYGGACNGLKGKGYIYQRVRVTPGRQLNARAWVWSWQQDNLGAFLSMTARCRVGIDPAGGTDYRSASIAWSPFTVAQDLFSSERKGIYCEAWTRATADSEYATVWVEGGADEAMAWTVFGIDDVVLTEAPPTPIARVSDLASLADGSFVEMTGKVIVALPEEVDAAYIEEPDRTAGVRVETGAAFGTGDRVTVVGVKNTRVSGEIVISNAVCTVESPGNPLQPLATTAANLNNNAPRTVGMLMRVAGQVTWDDNLNFWLNDGSLPGQKLRLDGRNLPFWPEHGYTYSVTGIVTLEGSSPGEAIAVLIPRSVVDIQQVYP